MKYKTSFRYLIIAALVLGLITSIVVSNVKGVTFISETDSNGTFYKIQGGIQGRLCLGSNIPSPLATSTLGKGLPFTKIITTHGTYGCDNFAYTGYYFSSWQFYANWLVWALPWLLVTYFLSRKNAHSRN